jgi:hypothetical protein
VGVSESPDFKLSGESPKEQEQLYFGRKRLTCDEFKLIEEDWISANSVRAWRL